MSAGEPEPDAAQLAAFTAAFRDATGYEGPVGHFAFGDTPEMADHLGALVLDGPKRATAGWAEDEDAAPTVGQHDVVLGGHGQPICLIGTTEVSTAAFDRTDPAFAWDEGEGDRTLAWWREAHLRFFSKRGEAIGRPFRDDSLVHLERFTLRWPERTVGPPLAEVGDVTVRAARPEDRAWVATVTADTTSSDGWRTDQLPSLLARAGGRTAGTLVFHPRPNGSGPTEVVAVAVLDDIDGAEDALRLALKELARRQRWGHPGA